MTQHRVTDELLLDYATGAAPEPLKLFVATHLALSPGSRRDAQTLEAVGDALFESLAPVAPAPEVLTRILARIDAEPAPVEAPRKRVSSTLPSPLSDHVPENLDELAWRKLIAGVFEAELACSTARYKTSLLRIEPGRMIPRHTHRGSEYILVLDGAFRDEYGHYARGDVAISDENVEHHPVADTDKRCLCLIVTEGPVRFTGPLSRLLNPFLRR